MMEEDARMLKILRRLDKELPLHVCNKGMGYYSDLTTGWWFTEKRHIVYSQLKTATPKDLVKYHKPHCVPVDPKQVEICKQFLLECCKKTDKVNKDWNSYGLKHAVEHCTKIKNNLDCYDYISNGAFIRAALDLGYRCEYFDGIGPEACLNISLINESLYVMSLIPTFIQEPEIPKVSIIRLYSEQAYWHITYTL
jgi:hypothetical protein